MRYCFDDYTLDPAAFMLTRMGQPAEVPHRVFECIHYLLEHRERAIGRDELILKLWGRPNVSDNQLAQVVLAARRLLADDGAKQRLIRTVPGVGYHWIGPVLEQPSGSPEPGLVFDAPLTELAVAIAAAPVLQTEVEPSAANALRTERTIAAPLLPVPPQASPSRLVWALVALTIVVVLSVAALGVSQNQPQTVPPEEAAKTSLEPASDPLLDLRKALRQARYEQVREGLARMPAALADTPSAQILAIELAVARGRFGRAEELLKQELSKARAADDAVWQAQLLSIRSTLRYRMRRPGVEILEPAQMAVDLLQSAEDAGKPVPTPVMAESLRVRGNGLVQTDQLDAALLDMSRARNLYQSIGDDQGSADLRVSMARVWMRMGRMTEALEQINDMAAVYARTQDPIREIFARNTATKIQIELLRWPEALASSDRSLQLLHGAPDSERRYSTLILRALVMTGLGRLREAASLMEEADPDGDRRDSVIPAIFHLATGDYDKALTAASDEFESNKLNCGSNLLLENRDGALLLWMTAAQELAGQGRSVPTPTSAQLAILENPDSVSAHIARGRWLWSRAEFDEAEAELRLGLEQARMDNQLYRMQLAGAPLLDLLIERGDLVAAERVLEELRAYDPIRLEQSFEVHAMNLRLALAKGSPSDIALAQDRLGSIAGERSLPLPIWIASAADPQIGIETPITILDRHGD